MKEQNVGGQNIGERPYSYHTFLLPFEIEGKCDEKLGSTEIIKKVLNQNLWDEIKDGSKEESVFGAIFLKEGEKEKIIRVLAYNQEQYFHENVKKAIHNYDGSNIVREFVYLFDNMEPNKKVIQLVGGRKEKKQYTLKVSNVRLKIFNTGVCILVLELYNVNYRSFKEVKEINALGRQISLPYIVKEEEEIACASEVTWSFIKDHHNKYNFQEKNDSFWKENFETKKIYMLDFLSLLIMNKKGRKNYQIKPSVDDRMFTCSLVQDESLSINYQSFTGKGNELSKSLYEFIYIDKEGKCSAPTEGFRKEILERSIYQRWKECQTLYGSSHTSFVAITGKGEDIEAIVTRPFLTEYVEIAILALVQRASILRFQKRVKGHLTMKEIQTLQSDYINYRNQLHFFEVSSQEQGIELYELIRKQLYIEKEMGELERNLEILYEKSNVDYGNSFNRFGLAIGFIGIFSIVLDVFSFVLGTDVTKNFCEQAGCLYCELFGIVIITVLISCSMISFIKKR